MNPSKEEREVWDRLDDAIREEKRIADGLDSYVKGMRYEDLADLLDRNQQAEYLRQRELNPPSWWQRLLGL